MTRRVSAFSILVPDYDQALDFYVGRLGFTLTNDIDQGHKRWVTVSPGSGPEIVLARATTPGQRAAIGNQTGGRVGFFLETSDFESDHAAMLAAGVVVEDHPRSESYGKVAVWRDPFGNRWDLIQFT